MSVRLCSVSEQPLDVAAHETAAASIDGGASVTFCGVVVPVSPPVNPEN